ncbi:MAG: hypothetical protein R3264_03355, partial [Anaerolineae bacterium]|nr:hypothetical protein [Anaerolineae bacterium]
MLSAGYRPYSEVYITYPPLYPLTIFTVWEVWPTEAAQRWFSLGFTAFGVVGIALLARRFAGPVAGVIAAVLALASSPLIEHSRAVMGEFHAVAWSVWAIWLAWGYLEAETVRLRRLLLILSALALSASLLTKLLLPFVGPLVGLIIIARWWPEKASLRDVIRLWQHNRPAVVARFKPLLADLLLWSVVLLLPIIIMFVVNDVGSLFQQVIAQRLDARDAYTSSDGFWTLRGKFGRQFWQSNPGFIIITLLGFGLAWFQRRRRLWLMVTWLGLAFLMLAVHNPIRYKHFLILTPPFAIFGAVAVTYWVEQVYSVWKPRSRGR